MTNLFDPPQVYDLPLSKGKDLVVDFQQRQNGQLTPYGQGVTVSLVIDMDPAPIVANAVIDTYHAIVTIQSEVADTVPKGKLWRCRVSVPASGLETNDLVPVNGRTIRYDGKPIA